MRESTLPIEVVTWCNICELGMAEVSQGLDANTVMPNGKSILTDFFVAFHEAYPDDDGSMLKSMAYGDSLKYVLCVLLKHLPKPLSAKEIKQEFQRNHISTKWNNIDAAIKILMDIYLIEYAGGIHFFRPRYRLVGTVDDIYQQLINPKIAF